MPKPTPEQIIAFINSDIEAPKPPSPYDIALTMGAALLSSGKFGDDFSAPMQHGWACVIPFYQGQKFYEEQGLMLFNMARHASAPEGDMGDGEARAYVTGGETGETGETGEPGRLDLAAVWSAQAGPLAMRQAEDAMRARQAEISRCDQLVTEAAAALAAARTAGGVRRIAKAQQAFDKACAAQSAAHTPIP
jgi:hypothetical protein